jgi:hypothetical protein
VAAITNGAVCLKVGIRPSFHAFGETIGAGRVFSMSTGTDTVSVLPFSMICAVRVAAPFRGTQMPPPLAVFWGTHSVCHVNR